MVFIVHDLKYVLLDISEHQEVLNSMSLTLRTPTQTMKIYDDANINISTFHEFAFKCNKIGVVENVLWTANSLEEAADLRVTLLT